MVSAQVAENGDWGINGQVFCRQGVWEVLLKEEAPAVITTEVEKLIRYDCLVDYVLPSSLCQTLLLLAASQLRLGTAMAVGRDGRELRFYPIRFHSAPDLFPAQCHLRADGKGATDVLFSSQTFAKPVPIASQLCSS